MNKHGLIAIALIPMLAGCTEVKNDVTKLRERLKKPVPVVIMIRESVAGNGWVAQFHNESDRRLVLRVTIENADKTQREEGALSIAPNGVEEIGWMEGWAFKPGDTITISHPDYRTQTWKFKK